jgi:hypothetical protein
MKFLIMLFPSTSYRLIPLQPKRSPQQPVFRHRQEHIASIFKVEQAEQDISVKQEARKIPLTFNGLHSVVSQNIVLLTITAVIASNGTLNLWSPLSIIYHVSQTYKTTAKTNCFIIFTFLDSRREDRRFWTEW